jgi:cell filamentation protein
MPGKNRYDTSELIEDQHEPGSRRRVLRNLLGIRGKRAMDEAEGDAQVRALEELVGMYGPDHRFRADDVCRMHAVWLGGIYAWAGRYRQVNLSKGEFPFAPAAQIPRLMREFEEGPLAEHTPCRPGKVAEIATALAIVHGELVLIHPFREGNGRVARMLAVLMALQAGYPLLDFGNVSGSRKQAYFAAIQASLGRDYGPLAGIFSAVLRRSGSSGNGA